MASNHLGEGKRGIFCLVMKPQTQVSAPHYAPLEGIYNDRSSSREANLTADLTNKKGFRFLQRQRWLKSERQGQVFLLILPRMCSRIQIKSLHCLLTSFNRSPRCQKIQYESGSMWPFCHFVNLSQLKTDVFHSTNPQSILTYRI